MFAVDYQVLIIAMMYPMLTVHPKKQKGNNLEEQPHSTGRHLAIDSKEGLILSAGISLLKDNIYKKRLTYPYTLT